MAVNKVIYAGMVLIDLSDSTVTAETLAEGVIAYNAKGERIVGTLKIDSDTDVTITETDGNIEIVGAKVTDDGNGNLTVTNMNVVVG